MSPSWSDAAGVAIVFAVLPLSAEVVAQPNDGARVCTTVRELPPGDDAQSQMDAVVGELRQGLEYFGHRLADDACDDEIGLSLQRDRGAWRLDVRAFGTLRVFEAPPGEAARAVVPEVLRYVDRALAGGEVLPPEPRRGRRARRGGAAPEEGTQWFPTIGFVASSVDRLAGYYGYPYTDLYGDLEYGHAEGGELAPTFSPTFGLALRWSAGADLSGQAELQFEHIGAQYMYVGPLAGEHTRALYLMAPVFARFRLATRRERDVHAYVGAQGGVKLFEGLTDRVVGVPIGSYDIYSAHDVFGTLLVGAVGGLQLERPSRIRTNRIQRREVDLRFGVVSHITVDGPRYGGTFGVRWRFGR